MNNKKVLAILLSLVFVFSITFSLAACGGGSAPATSGTGTSESGTGSTDTGSGDTILVGRVVPLTGFLASFGVGSPDVEQKAIDEINADGGIFIEEYGAQVPIKLITYDSESDPTKASEAATKLITQDKVNVMTGSHTPLTVNPVSATAERYQMPCVTVEAPSDPWFGESDHYWSFHVGFTFDMFATVMVDMWDKLDTNKVVGLLMDNQDGAATRQPVIDEAEARGYTIVDPGLITVGTNDYTSMINQFKAAGVEIITGNMNLPDFSTCWNQFQQADYIPKIVAIGRAALFPDNAATIGTEYLSTEIWWTPTAPYTSDLFGISATELSNWYEQTTGEQTSAVIGYKYANMEILIDALKRAGTLDAQTLRDTIAATDLNTVIGHITYNELQYCEPMLMGGQWVVSADGKWTQNIVANTFNPLVPLSDTPMTALIGS